MADLTELLECNSAYNVVGDVVDDLVDAAGEILYDHYVEVKVSLCIFNLLPSLFF